MDQATLRILLSRYMSNECTEEERQLVEYWYELLGEPVNMELTEPEWQALETRIWLHLQPEPARPAIVRPLWRRLAIASSALAGMLIIGAGFIWYKQLRSDTAAGVSLVGEEEQAQWQQYGNNGPAKETIYLSDSSMVTLEPGSLLAVSTGFNQTNRELRLKGEAVFDVKRNRRLPFIVYSGNIAAKALGTRFRVKALETAKTIEVDVQSGKVTVYQRVSANKSDPPAHNGLILTPNQKATFFPESNQFVAGLTDNPEPVNVPEAVRNDRSAFEFDETPVLNIIRQLEEAYGTEIELEHEELGNCPFTGNLTHQPLYHKLDLICGSLNGSYEIRGTKILITGKGCN